jgi:hypothetical protein
MIELHPFAAALFASALLCAGFGLGIVFMVVSQARRARDKARETAFERLETLTRGLPSIGLRDTRFRFDTAGPKGGARLPNGCLICRAGPGEPCRSDCPVAAK